eukprot:5105-Heterococcus_DN1.PRE.9
MHAGISQGTVVKLIVSAAEITAIAFVMVFLHNLQPRSRPARFFQLSYSMDRGRRAMPMGNKACNERHVRKCQDLHRQQLATVKSTIDNGPPKSTKKGALTTNAKKQQIM